MYLTTLEMHGGTVACADIHLLYAGGRSDSREEEWGEKTSKNTAFTALEYMRHTEIETRANES